MREPARIDGAAQVPQGDGPHVVDPYMNSRIRSLRVSGAIA
jgi:hypothetical protein